jgi:hypothetical protein
LGVERAGGILLLWKLTLQYQKGVENSLSRQATLSITTGIVFTAEEYRHTE